MTSSAQPRWIVPVSTLCAGVALGFIVGKEQQGDAPAPDHGSLAPRVRLDSEHAQIHVQGGDKRNGALVHGVRGLAGAKDYPLFSAARLAEEAMRLEHLPVAERSTETLLLFACWGQVDPSGALAQAKSLGMFGDAARREVLKGWSQIDPVAASNWFMENAGDFPRISPAGGIDERQAAASIIARSWARQDPDAALTWAMALGPESLRSVSSVLGETASSDPDRAVRLLESAGSAFLKESCGEIAWQWAGRNFPAAEKWIRTLPATQRDAAMSKAVLALSIGSPRLAAKYLDVMPEGVDRQLAIVSVAKRLAHEDAVNAESWLNSQSDEITRRGGMIGFITSVAARDPDAARDVLASMSPGPARDGASAAYIRSSPFAEPEALMALASGISNDADRGQSIAWIISRWRQEDNAAAERYIIENYGNSSNGQ